jgi:voltage-gated potassium channel
MALNVEAREAAVRRFERTTAWPMLFLALAIIPIIVVPMVTHLSKQAEATLLAADWLIWAAFAIEYIVRAFLSPRKWHFFTHNLIDFVVVAVPFAQPLRLIRSLRLLRLARGSRVVAFAAKGAKEGRSLFSRENFSYALLVSFLAILGGAALVLSVERSVPNANIRSFPDAVWWAIVTVATVGYGDKYPVTAEGRAIAVVLMVLGIGLFGLIAATLSSFFVEQQNRGQLAAINKRLEAIEGALADRVAGQAPRDAGPDGPDQTSTRTDAPAASKLQGEPGP